MQRRMQRQRYAEAEVEAKKAEADAKETRKGRLVAMIMAYRG
jgi:hypothetical protein